MVKSSDSIICYVGHYGNARRLLDCARKQRHLSIHKIAVQDG